MKLLSHLPIRNKIILVTMITAVTALLLAGGALALFEVGDSRLRLERELATAAKIIGANSVAAISFGDKAAATETLTALRGEPQILAACIYDSTGVPFAMFSREGFKASFPSTPGPDGSVRAGNRLIYFGEIQDERERSRAGTIYFEADFSGLLQRLKSNTQLLGLVLATSCLVALGLSSLLQRYISEPIVKLGAIMKAVSKERDYSLRLPEESRDELGQLSAGFNQMLRQIETAHGELESFSYSVSHDLRAPLRAVDGFSHALLEDYGTQLPEEGQRQLQTIRKGAQQMGALIDDLLTFSRLSRLPLNKQKINSSNLVRGVLRDLQSPREAQEIDVRLGELPACQGDPALLKQVWINLLSNAFKYTQNRALAVVEVGCSADNGKNIFFVRDNGTGFDMRYANKLFGVFQRLHRAEEFEGTGVGLAIVQQIIHRHGGRVWAKAAPDQGATFYFTLEGTSNYERK